jgi:hypothetical protein
MLPFSSLSENDDERKLATREERDETEEIKAPPEKVVDATDKPDPYREVMIGNDKESGIETETTKNARKRAGSDEDGEPSSPRSKHPRLEPEITGSKGRKADNDAKIDTDTADKTPAKPKDDGSISNKSSGSFSSADSKQKIGSDDDNLDRKPHAEQTITISEDILDGKTSDGNLKVSAQAASRKRGTAAQKTRTSSFPEKLMHLLNTKDGKESICWLPDGTAFAISPRNFEQHILPKYFENTKLESFTRKLNRWGFKRVSDEVTPGSFTYYHPLFQRGFPTLCRSMNGGKRADKIALSSAQVQILQSMQGENMPSDAALMAVLMGGANPPDRGVPLMLGGESASYEMMSSLSGQLPGISSGNSRAAARDGGVSTGLEMMMLKQELLRHEAMKNQEELMFQQKLGELIRRKAEDERLQALLQGQQPFASGIPPQILAELMMRGGSDPSARPSAMFPSQMRSPTLASSAAATSASFPSSANLPSSAADLAASGDSALIDEFAKFLRQKRQQEARQNWDYQQRLMQHEMMDHQLQARDEREQQQARQDSDYRRLLMQEEMARQFRAREGQQPTVHDPVFHRLAQEEMVHQLRGGREERDPRFRQS